jgi:ubiquinone/menaquinone biosynthesis C-methylase UbiE
MAFISRYKQSFGLVSKEYKKYRWSYNDKLYKTLFSLVKAKEHKEISILDLGCGVGNSTEPMLQMASKMKFLVSIIGCDIDERMLKEARASAKKNGLPIVYVPGEAEKLPFEREQFDVVTSGAAFHWFATKKAMKEVRRVLKVGGIYFVFWTQNVGEKNKIIGKELYGNKKYKWQGIPRKLRKSEYVKDIFIKNGFEGVTVVKIPHVERRTMDETIGLIKTNSSYALLSPEDKKTFIKEMKKDYKKIIGDGIDTVRQEINVCYGMRTARPTRPGI